MEAREGDQLNPLDAERLIDRLDPWCKVGYTEVSASPAAVTVSMELRGCEPEDVSVTFQPRGVAVRLLIGEQPLYEVGLPVPVDPGRARFTIRNGVLDAEAPLPEQAPEN